LRCNLESFTYHTTAARRPQAGCRLQLIAAIVRSIGCRTGLQ
jgi:hypothetical protein